ncbi:phage tail assembly protein [Burkholderia sp. FERM BP-3421]|jgi:hypothetical protein|uniref:phage tail assembly protein n=1 Tax=Burkholderia sp. FERM BP-3421 TaxID=1494466 RepID=UPI002360A556|nr:phage tail assembly protein [Burkholderia sp. FERM BP-3421]WDD95923.1 phage tail assembly protein [Burkholderia sp. FERM BP-3421]
MTNHAQHEAVRAEAAASAIPLDTPIVRDGETIAAVTLRKPTAGELRGTSLHDLARFDVSALQKVLPRITSPSLTEFEVGQLDPADLLALAGAFSDFLLSRSQKAAMASPSA